MTTVPCSWVNATAAAATAVTATLAAEASTARIVKAVVVSVSGAASGDITLTVKDGTNTVYEQDLTLTDGASYTQTFGDGLVGTEGNAVAVTVSAGAASCVTKLNVGFLDQA